MPVKKGTDNFLQHRQDNVRFLKDRIQIYLTNLRSSKARFDNLNKLSSYLCARLTEDVRARWELKGQTTLEPKPVSKSTLYRNTEYRALLDSFIAGLPIDKGVSTAMAKASLPASQAKITEQALTISNLRNKINILERYIERQCDQEEENDTPTPLLNTNDDNIHYVQTARALNLVLEASEGLFAIDPQKQLIATHKIVNNVVVNAETLKSYLTWFDMQDIASD